jgi:hypothetical protein
MSSNKSSMMRLPRPKRNPRKKSDLTPQHPPSFNSTIVGFKRFRYQAVDDSAITGYQATSAELVAQLVMLIDNGPGLTKNLFTNIKIKRVSLWSTVVSDTTGTVPQTVGIEFSSANTGGFTNPNNRVTDTSVGNTRVAAVSVKPSKLSSAAYWQGSASTGDALVLFYTKGAILDVELSFTIQDGEAPVSGPAAGAGLGADGRIYQTWLGKTAAAGSWQPVGYSALP